MLEDIAKREKLIFFLSAFQVNQNGEGVKSHTLGMDVNRLSLVNASGFKIKTAYYDHNLDQPIVLPQHTNGFLYFPLSVVYKEVCTEVLNPTYNTKIILQLPLINIDGVSSGPFSWTIDYTYLLNTGNFSYGSNHYVPPDTEIRSSNTPPTATEISDAFWEQYAKFMWAKLTPKHE